MANFGPASEAKLQTCHPDIQRVLRRAILDYDFSVICGWRSAEKQAEAVRNGASLADWPTSNHNQHKGDRTLSGAADCVPYPIEWPDKKADSPTNYVRKMLRFYQMALVILESAKIEQVNITWGGTFDFTFDGPHFELA